MGSEIDNQLRFGTAMAAEAEVTKISRPAPTCS